MAGRGSRSTTHSDDPAWQWCTRVDGRLRVKCNFCGQEMSSGVSRLKHHLAETRKGVAPCKGTIRKVPDAIKWQCLQMIGHLTERRQEREDAGSWEEEEQPTEQGHNEYEEGIGSSSRDRGKRPMEETTPSPRQFFRGRSRGRRGSSRRDSGIRSYFPPGTTPGSQPGIRAAMATEEIREQAEMAVARWFYDTCIPFNAANSFYFQPMADAIANMGPGFKMPSFHKLRGKLLDKSVAEVNQYCESLRETWKVTGCSIMADGWTDRRGRTLINFLIYCPKGLMFLKSLDLSEERHTAEVLKEEFNKVILEVGPENVVQFITDNAANYKAAAKELADETYHTFYWTPCAAHCIDLILEDIGKMDEVKAAIECCQDITRFIYNHSFVLCMMRKYTGGAELLRTATTRFATHFLSVQSIVKQKQPLKQMFTSDEWQEFANLPQNRRNGKLKEIVDIVSRSTFWNSCVRLLKTTCPLVKVLRLADSEEKPSMGYFYEAMDRAKEAIRNNFNGKKRDYMPVWKIIDGRWNRQLHQPIHAAAYYLNPAFRHSTSFRRDSEVNKGIVDCIDRLVPDLDTVDAIHREMEIYDSSLDMMGLPVAIRNRNLIRPDVWWDRFGNDCPHLRDFAVKVLSQTCSATGCERNWSVFEAIHTKKRNRLEHKRLNDLVFVRCNIRLKERQNKKKASSSHATQFDPICLDHFDVLEEWVEEDNEANALLSEEDVRWINLEGGGPSQTQGDEDIEFDPDDDEEGDDEEEYYLVDDPDY